MTRLADVDGLIRHRSLTLDVSGYKLIGEEKIELLTASQMRLMELLVREPTRVHTVQALSLAMREGGKASDDALKACISRLRLCLRRLGYGNQFLHSVRGLGYIFDPEAR